jgi:hypothetical protein
MGLGDSRGEPPDDVTIILDNAVDVLCGGSPVEDQHECGTALDRDFDRRAFCPCGTTQFSEGTQQGRPIELHSQALPGSATIRRSYAYDRPPGW